MASNYWEQRAVDSIGRMENAVNGQIPDLVQSFEAARRDLNNQIERFFVRYAKNNQISLADAQQQLSFSELRDFKGDLAQYTHLAKDSIGVFNLQVDNMSVKARISRLEALQMQCDAVLQNLYQEQQGQIESTATGVYTSEYYHSLFDIEKYTGFNFEFSKPATDTIQKVIEQPVQGMDISEHLWRQDIDTGFRIRQTLNNMFVTGKPPQYFADELGKAIGAVQVDKNGNVTGKGKKYEAYRLLYNESAHCVNQAQLQAYRDDGIDEFENMATLDRNNTCDTCGYFDGKHYPVKDAVEGENHPSFHVNCRCTTAPYIPDLDDLSNTRVARDTVTGEPVETTASNYDDWINQQNAKYGMGTVAKQRRMAQNESSDFAQYQKYKGTLKEDAPQTFANFQKVKYNGAGSWETLKQSYAETSRFNRLSQKASDLNIKGTPVKDFDNTDISDYQFANQHINKDRRHSVSKDEAQTFIDNAAFAIDRWNGQVRIFISENGASVVNLKDKIVSTAYKSSEYDDKFRKLMEELKND